jgi:DNA-binding transcriptional ArsR family regulator
MPDIAASEPTTALAAEGSDIVAAVPDYSMAAVVRVDSPAHFKALADPTRRSILDLVLERAATTTELAEALQRPKGTVDHHLKVLAQLGLIQVVRTRKVRAMTERYWGRTARTILYDLGESDDSSSCTSFIRDALEESSRVAPADDLRRDGFTTLRHARVAPERLAEFSARLAELALEFTALERGGDVEYGLLIALYPTDRPTLPDRERERAS